MTTLAVCIATRDRPRLLASTLEAIAAQSRRPDEVVVVDASQAPTPGTHDTVRWLRTGEVALPRLRRLAWQAAHAERVLFLDDDVRLVPEALARLENAWDALDAGAVTPVAGLGLLKVWDDGTRPERDPQAIHERWLGTRHLPSGVISPGGLGVTHDGLTGPGPVPVGHLWGGAMAFPRWVLERIGMLDALERLYAAGLGRGEDVVLSRQAAGFGDLWLLPEPLARHRRETGREPTPYASAGWRLGLTATWGRAQSLRWVAPDAAAARRTWYRLVTLEVARSGWGIVRAPWRAERWSRLGGALAGGARGALAWRRLPTSPGAR